MSYSALHNHSEYSLLDGFPHPEEYIKRIAEIGLKSFAITEHGNQYSFIYFSDIINKYKKLIKDNEKQLIEEQDIEKISKLSDEIETYKKYINFKMIYGVELYECFDINIQDNDNKYFHLVALAKNEKGRIALNEIITQSNFKGFYYKPRVDLEMLKPYAENLVISTACLASKIARESDYNKCVKYINEYKSIFPHFYLEMQSHNSIDQEKYNQKIIQLSKDTNTSFIITTDSHVTTKEELIYQARHVQIARDSDTLTESYEGCYLQTEEEIHEIMDKQVGIDNVNLGLQNTNIISDLIDNVKMPFQEPKLPHFPLPKGYKNNYEFIRKLINDGWKTRKIDNLSEVEIKIRKKRIEYELEVIHKMDFDGYFLIVWDFINFCRENNIMVAPGRGSCSGSLVCYLLYITDLDPIKYNLIFERFLNIERISMPDTDTDVSDRDKVIKYLIEKYGEEKVCQVINFSYITPIVAVKDVGRVLKIPYNICDEISKKFVFDTFQETMNEEPDILDKYKDYEEYEQIQDLFKIASKLSGRVRQASIHAGGVGIVDTKITDYMAMKLGSKGEHVIQVDKKMIERVGIIKYDILGVQTLNLIQQVINDTGIDPFEININNPKFEEDIESYTLLGEANTNGIFQVESQGMKDLLLRLNPTTLEELSAVIALYRPDSMKALEDFIYYKHHIDEIKYIHNDMKPIVEKTYGCMIYQEQLLEIVRTFGGRTYGGADKFRKGIGKKNKKLVQEESDKLYKEIIQTGYKESLALNISNDMRTKGGYLFNKSHSCSYAVVCLQTAYLKKHYPVQFFKALLNINKDDNGVLNKYIVDATNSNIRINPPHINKSNREFIINNNEIIFGLLAIRGIGEAFVNQILEERKNGIFKNFKDFKERVTPSDSQIITLVKAGAIPTKDKKNFLIKYALSTFVPNKYEDRTTTPSLGVMKETYGIDTDKIKDKSERLRLLNIERKRIYEKEVVEKRNVHMEAFIEKDLQDEEMWEFQSLSIFINNNPFKEIYEYIKPYEEIKNGESAVIVGVISNITKKKDRNKHQFAYVSLYSAFGVVEITCWYAQFNKHQDIIKKGSKMALLCKKKEDKFFVEGIKPYDKWFIDVKKTGIRK